MSIPRIAEMLGVGEATVYRDLSGVSNETPENTPAATGADGKTYPARQRTAGLMAGRSRTPGAGRVSCASASLKKKRSNTHWR
ncbi:hypothetical protein [Rhodothermus marinus]|uniref:hypothetical protein n=1 Tax=Rhodothermus marinus TaxID=29549 RepID=UPI0034E1BD82